METIAKRDHFQEVTQKIIVSLENGVVPWRQPWGFVEAAQNHFSGHRYRGINSLLMLLDDYKTPYFATIRQINEAGGRVRKGARSAQVYFHDCLYKDSKTGAKLKPEDALQRLKMGDKNVSRYPYLRLFPVFNMQDVEGTPVKPLSQRNNEDNQPIAVCNDFVTALDLGEQMVTNPATNGAYYDIDRDRIVVPTLPRFDSSEFYYTTLFHELGHFTGHASRLNRPGITDETARFGSAKYAREELIAELTACFLANHFGIDIEPLHDNSASYIAFWLGVLKQDKRLIWDAASDAQAAFTHLLQRADQFALAQ